MKKLHMNLYTKILVLVIFVIFISISFVLPFMTELIALNIKDKAEINVMNTAKIVANSPLIREALSRKDPEKLIQAHTKKILADLSQIEYIVVADMNSIRYSHPSEGRIGEEFQGGDQEKVLHGETYTSQATGTLGKSTRAFVPLYDLNDEKQIGFVSVGALRKRINHSMIAAIRSLFLFALIGLSVGSIGAVLLSKNIKKTLLGLEPKDIVKLYHEKRGMLDALDEGIIAIDDKCKITLVNEAAYSILQLKDKCKEADLLGRDISEVFENTALPSTLEYGVPEYDKEIFINDTIIVANRVPVKNQGKIIGAIATFRDKTEVTRLAEEVTGVNLIVSALRANSHEFSNKLHLILGLLHLGEIEEAKTFISDITKEQQQIMNMVIKRIKEPTIAGLILGKISRAKELGIEIEIDKGSYLESVNSSRVNSNILVTIIGNLLENAFEAVSKSNNESRKVYLKIQEFNDIIEIEVIDTGIGINEGDIVKIFERGFTTKEGSQGVGLELVKNIVDNLNGEIEVRSKLYEGVDFKIILPK